MTNTSYRVVSRQIEYTKHLYTYVALIAQLGEHCTGIAEVVGSNPAQSLNFFQVSVLVVFNGRICIYYRYHSIATMGQISFIFTVLGPSQNVPI